MQYFLGVHPGPCALKVPVPCGFEVAWEQTDRWYPGQVQGAYFVAPRSNTLYFATAGESIGSYNRLATAQTQLVHTTYMSVVQNTHNGNTDTRCFLLTGTDQPTVLNGEIHNVGMRTNGLPQVE